MSKARSQASRVRCGADGELRFVLMPADGGAGRSGGGSTSAASGTSGDDVTAIREWVTQNCTTAEGLSDLYSCTPS